MINGASYAPGYPAIQAKSSVKLDIAKDMDVGLLHW